MPDYYTERRGVRSSEAVIDRKELERLRTMARRGEAYEAAARTMRNRHVVMAERRQSNPDDEYVRGWLDGLRELVALIVRTE